MALYFFKSLHFVGFVAWFAGLFYLVRMFVYHVEALEKPQPERDILAYQFNRMQWRVYRIICNPALAITWFFGAGMLFIHGFQWLQGNHWMYFKIVLLFLLTWYHFWCKGVIKKLERGESDFSSFQYRLLNEVPTLLLVAIVLLAVYRNMLHFGYAFVGLVLFMMLLYLGVKAYEWAREKYGDRV